MQAIIEWKGKRYAADLSRPHDISIPLRSGARNPNAFGIPQPVFEPLRAGEFVGSVSQGGPVNCENLFMNPHGNGTHTECVGHISHERITINESLRSFFSIAQVLSVEIRDQMIRLADVEPQLKACESVVFRSLPNTVAKMTQVYSGNSPSFFEPELCLKLRERGVLHLLTDLPSVDPEEDAGALAAHHAYWNYPEAPTYNSTITEMIFVPDSIPDGLYLLNIQIASIESDASPSKPVLYALKKVGNEQ